MPPRADVRAIKAQVVGSLASRVNLEVLTAGREVVQQSSRRWRRVTDGNPCGFCAMLASRGPVYTSEESASRIGGRGKAIDPTAPRKRGGQAKGVRARGKGKLGDKFHTRCGCTVEPFEGDPADWVPTADEQRFIDAYEATNEPGLSELERSKAIQRWLDENPPTKAAAEVVELSIDGLDDDAIDALMDRLAGAGDWVGAERVQELADARRAALKPTPWKPDPSDPFNPQTYEWFEGLDVDEQIDFLGPMRNREMFEQQQWSHINAKSAPKRGSIPLVREMRAEWDAFVEVEWVRLEEVTNGVTLTAEARAAGIRTRDLYRTKSTRMARKWASEEVRRYWDENGRMTFESFRAGYTGGLEALGAQRAGFWA